MADIIKVFQNRRERKQVEEAPPPSLPKQMYYRIPEVAAMFSLSRDTIERMIRRGELKTVTVSGSRRIPQWSLEAYDARLRAEVEGEEVAPTTYTPAHGKKAKTKDTA